MSRRQNRTRLVFDTSLSTLPEPDIRTILRAADPLIATAGRTMLIKVLRGSRAQDVLKHGMDDNPCYGAYQDRSEAAVLAMVDWMILNDYLGLDFDGDLPLLFYTQRGWRIEREIVANELIDGFDKLLAQSAPPYDMLYLKDRSRDMILLLLEILQERADPKYVPILEAWAQVDYAKVRKEIARVIAHLGAPAPHSAATSSTPAATSPPVS